MVQLVMGISVVLAPNGVLKRWTAVHECFIWAVVGLVSREPRLRRYGREFRRNYGGLEDLFTQVLMRF